MTGHRRLEQGLHRAAVDYLRIMENLHHLLFFHPANGGGRSRTEAGILTGMGVRPGVPDQVLLLPGARAAFVELKAGAGRLSTAQVAFKEQVEALGFCYAECHSVDEVGRFVRGLITGGADQHRQGGGAGAPGERAA